jgi:hypothetical protein
MNISDAAYHTAHDFPGGVPALAVRMGMSQNVLQNKVNPSQEHHKLTLAEAVKLQALTGDMRILHAMAAALGHVALPLADLNTVSDMQLLDDFMHVIRELGEFSQEFQKDWADGRITPEEFERIKQEAYDVQARMAALLQRIESLVEQPSLKAVA